ncbi:rCG20450 [Rattus norvegicus]|uniref:RCG20450 n=1 Tax=Rattus norvegicus TaxID=10116 RepID=A6JH04_RAT|nr:rCG20450 [Rattus norvegicus]
MGGDPLQLRNLSQALELVTVGLCGCETRLVTSHFHWGSKLI